MLSAVQRAVCRPRQIASFATAITCIVENETPTSLQEALQAYARRHDSDDVADAVSSLQESVRTTDGVIQSEFGLSLFLETESGNTILFDFGGPGEALVGNAEILGIDLNDVDYAVLSHGHGDHSGGLPAFCAINQHAPIYVHEGVAARLEEGEALKQREFYMQASDGSGRLLDLTVPLGDFWDRVEFLGSDDDFRHLSEGVQVVTSFDQIFPLPNGSEDLKVKIFDDAGTAVLEQDTFDHELCLIISASEESERGDVLLTGCSHNGIDNILHAVEESCSIETVIGGLHLVFGEQDFDGIGECLNGPSERKFFANHCTGVGAFYELHARLPDDFSYLACGETVLISDGGVVLLSQEERKSQRRRPTKKEVKKQVKRKRRRDIKDCATKRKAMPRLRDTLDD